METKATLKVVRTRVKRVLIYLMIEKSDPLFVTMDTRCKLYFERDNILQLACPPLMLRHARIRKRTDSYHLSLTVCFRNKMRS